MENEEQEPEEELTEVVRYLPFESALRTICGRNLRLSFVRDFNDPFEFYCQDGGELSAREVCHDYALHRVGLLCFSHPSTLSEPLMWSHYASNHQGVALRFRVSGGQKGSTTHVLPATINDVLQSIDYDQSERFDAFPDVREIGACLDLERKLAEWFAGMASVKGGQWSYEREKRAVIPVNTHQDFISLSNNGMYLVKFDPSDLIGVVFGWRTPKVSVSKLMAILDTESDFKNVIIETSHPHPSKWKVEQEKAKQEKVRVTDQHRYLLTSTASSEFQSEAHTDQSTS